MTGHILDRSKVLLTIPPRFNCSCGTSHSSEEWEELVTEETLALWSEAVLRESDIELPSAGDADGPYGEDR